MTRTLLIPVLLAVLVAPLMLACAEEGDVDPYALVTLRDVSRGMVVSKGFKYKFQNPEIVGLHRNLGLIRQGNILEFIAGPSLEDKLVGKMDGFFELAVVKKFSPFVHFKVERIATETDTSIITPRSISYPQLTTAAEYTTDTYEQQDIDKVPYNNTGVLRGLKDKKIKLKAKITIEEEEGTKFFVLHGKNAKFRIGDTTDGIGLILKVLAEKGYVFDGGIILTEVEGYSSRMKTKVAGTVSVQFVNYGTRIVTG